MWHESTQQPKCSCLRPWSVQAWQLTPNLQSIVTIHLFQNLQRPMCQKSWKNCIQTFRSLLQLLTLLVSVVNHRVIGLVFNMFEITLISRFCVVEPLLERKCEIQPVWLIFGRVLTTKWCRALHNLTGFRKSTALSSLGLVGLLQGCCSFRCCQSCSGNSFQNLSCFWLCHTTLSVKQLHQIRKWNTLQSPKSSCPKCPNLDRIL